MRDGVQHCEFMHNGGLMQTLWLCIMRLMHGEDLLNVPARVVEILCPRTSVPCSHAVVAFALALAIVVYMCFPGTSLLGVCKTQAWRLLRNVKSGVLSNVVMPASCLLQQYYRGKGKWEYMPVVGFAKAFDQTEMAKTTRGSLAQPYQAPNPKCEEALITYKYALNGKSLTVHNFGSWSQQMHGTHHLLSLRILYRVVNLLVVHGKYSSE